MIYCVEDEDAIRDLMIYTLKSAGFDACGFASGEDFRKALAGKDPKPDLILLDIMLPGEDGISILKRLRDGCHTADIPVIMTTAKGSEFDKVTGLDSGADDYLCKPFGMMEMLSRIKAVLRRANPKENRIYKCGGIVLDEDRHLVKSGEKTVNLTLKEYDLLKIFMRNPGLVFTRERLLSMVWDTDYAVETRTVDVHIGTLRTKLEANGEMIKTVRGIGYRMEDGDAR